MKVFLDTNVLVSAFGTRGLCADLVRFVLAEHELVTGEVNLRELRRILRDRFGVPQQTIVAVEKLLREQTVVPRPKAPLGVVVRDPDDAWVLASAVAAGAAVLITGDTDLLSIAGDSPIPIVNPRGFWNMVRRGRRGR